MYYKLQIDYEMVVNKLGGLGVVIRKFRESFDDLQVQFHVENSLPK